LNINLLQKKYLILLLFFCNFVSAQVSYQQVSFEQKELVFYEDFNDSNKVYQDDFTGEYFKFIRGNFSTNTYSIKNGNYILEESSLEGSKACVVDIPKKIDPKRNFEIELSLNLQKANDKYGSGIFWGMNSNGNGYGFYIKDQANYKIARLPSKTYPALKEWTTCKEIQNGKFNILTIRKMGPTYFFFINKQMVHQCDFEDFYGEKLFLQCGARSQISIDYVSICYLNTPEQDKVKTAAKTPHVKTSDIDSEIPETKNNKPQTFALVFGNEDYESSIKVAYAKNDAEVFSDYLNKTIGIPKSNIHLVLNASYGKMLKEIDWLKNVLLSFKGDCEVFFYYAGHGMPNEETKEAFLVPVDGDPANFTSSIPLATVYNSIGNLPSKKTVFFIDACFSGGSREGDIGSGRGMKLKPKENKVEGNSIVFSAASNTQIAGPYTEKQHGLFTYFLLKKIRDTKGEVSLKELSDFVSDQVQKQSAVQGKTQQPNVSISETIVNDWQQLKLK
jgi:hypothetical protein